MLPRKLLNPGFRRGFSILHALKNVETITSSAKTAMIAETRGRSKPMIGNITLRRPREPAPAMQALDERINALEITAEVEVSIVSYIGGLELSSIQREEVAQEGAYYSENDLAAFYQDVLANPFEDEAQLQVNEQALRKAQAAQDSALVQAIYERFNVEGMSSSSGDANVGSEQPVQVILSRLESIVSRLEATERLVGAEKTHFPISILTLRECEALVRVSVRQLFSSESYGLH